MKIAVYNWKRKDGVTPKNATPNHFTTDLLLIFSGGLQKLLILMNTANLFWICFATPKLNRATPDGVATLSLRSPALNNRLRLTVEGISVATTLISCLLAKKLLPTATKSPWMPFLAHNIAPLQSKSHLWYPPKTRSSSVDLISGRQTGKALKLTATV